MAFKVGPGAPVAVFSRRFAIKTEVEVTLHITGGRQDIITYVMDPDRNVVASSQTRRVRGTATMIWQTTEPGDYELVIDNSFSKISSKIIHVTLEGF